MIVVGSSKGNSIYGFTGTELVSDHNFAVTCDRRSDLVKRGNVITIVPDCTEQANGYDRHEYRANQQPQW